MQLLSSGISPNAPDADGQRPLILYCAVQNLKYFDRYKATEKKEVDDDMADVEFSCNC